jgi:hypothetical protein
LQHFLPAKALPSLTNPPLVSFSTSITTQCLPLDWTVRAYDPLSIPKGGCIDFTWSGFHDLIQISEASCGSIATGTELAAPSPGETYAWFVPSDAESGSSYYFACSVGSHCLGGQLIQVNVE